MSLRKFEQSLMPHLDSAYNLARWLCKDDQDARDVAQDAYLKAIRRLGTLQGSDARPWLLSIVRNTAYTWLRRRGIERSTQVELDEDAHAIPSGDDGPEAILFRESDRARVQLAIEGLPIEYREAIVLREIEGLSYEEIAVVSAVPLGTVMSRISRGRKRLVEALGQPGEKEVF